MNSVLPAWSSGPHPLTSDQLRTRVHFSLQTLTEKLDGEAPCPGKPPAISGPCFVSEGCGVLSKQQVMILTAQQPGGRVGLTPSMGATSRSYRARSGGLANELCLLGREEVPSLMGDAVLPTRLVILWQLLGREGGDEAGHAGPRLRFLEKAAGGYRRGHTSLPPGLASFSLSGTLHRTVSADRNRRANQLHTTAYVSVEFFCIITCPGVLFKGFNYILVWSDREGKCEHQKNWRPPCYRGGKGPKANLQGGSPGHDRMRIMLAATWAHVKVSPRRPCPSTARGPLGGQQYLHRVGLGAGQLRSSYRVLFGCLIYVPVFPGKFLLIWMVFSTLRTPRFTFPTQDKNIH